MRQEQNTQVATQFLGSAYPKGGITASYRIEVAGEPVDIKQRSLRIKDSVDHRPICSFTIRDLEGIKHYKKGMPVQILDWSTGGLVFAGVVNSSKESVISQTKGGLWHKVQVAGNYYYAGRRIAAQSYENTAAGDIVQELMQNYLTAEGITAGTIETGPIINAAVINYVYVDEALDKLAEIADFIWYITPDKELNFHKRATMTAPFDADGTIAQNGSIDVTHANDKYRNRQYIRGGVNITDPQTESRTGDGKTKAWTLGFPLAKEPTVKVDGVTKSVGINGVEKNKDFYWTKGEHAVSQDSQAAPIASGSDIQFTYQGSYKVIALSSDQTAIDDRKTVEGSGTGYVEDIDDEPSTENLQAGFQLANALLQKYTKIGRTLKYRTRVAGLRAGMLQTANFPEHGLDGIKMLIQEVSISDQGPTLWYDVTAVEGPVIENWAKWMAKGLKQQKVLIDKVNIGEENSLTILAQTSEIWSWSEQTSAAVFACPVPSSTLYPSNTVIPC